MHFFGDEGEVKVNRGKFEFWRDGKQIQGKGGSLTSTIVHVQKEYLANAKIKLYESRHHIKDFLECVASRKKPVTNEIIGGRTAICCHLMNQAYYNHETIKWKPKRMRFAWRSGEKAWLTRDYREPYTLS